MNVPHGYQQYITIPFGSRMSPFLQHNEPKTAENIFQNQKQHIGSSSLLAEQQLLHSTEDKQQVQDKKISRVPHVRPCEAKSVSIETTNKPVWDSVHHNFTILQTVLKQQARLGYATHYDDTAPHRSGDVTSSTNIISTQANAGIIPLHPPLINSGVSSVSPFAIDSSYSIYDEKNHSHFSSTLMIEHGKYTYLGYHQPSTLKGVDETTDTDSDDSDDNETSTTSSTTTTSSGSSSSNTSRSSDSGSDSDSTCFESDITSTPKRKLKNHSSSSCKSNDSNTSQIFSNVTRNSPNKVFDKSTPTSQSVCNVHMQDIEEGIIDDFVFLSSTQPFEFALSPAPLEQPDTTPKTKITAKKRQTRRANRKSKRKTQTRKLRDPCPVRKPRTRKALVPERCQQATPIALDPVKRKHSTKHCYSPKTVNVQKLAIVSEHPEPIKTRNNSRSHSRCAKLGELESSQKGKRPDKSKSTQDSVASHTIQSLRQLPVTKKPKRYTEYQKAKKMRAINDPLYVIKAEFARTLKQLNFLSLSKGDRVKLQALPDNRDGCAVRKFFIPPGTIGIIAEAPTFPVTWIKVLVGDKEIGMRTSNFVRLDPPSREIDPSQRQMVMDRLQRTVCFNILHDNLRVKIQVKNKLYDGVVSKAPNFPSTWFQVTYNDKGKKQTGSFRSPSLVSVERFGLNISRGSLTLETTATIIERFEDERIQLNLPVPQLDEELIPLPTHQEILGLQRMMKIFPGIDTGMSQNGISSAHSDEHFQTSEPAEDIKKLQQTTSNQVAENSPHVTNE